MTLDRDRCFFRRCTRFSMAVTLRDKGRREGKKAIDRRRASTSARFSGNGEACATGPDGKSLAAGRDNRKTLLSESEHAWEIQWWETRRCVEIQV